MSYQAISKGGISTPAGFEASGSSAGIKEDRALDCALVRSQVPALAAAAFTESQFSAPSVQYDRALMKRHQRINAIFVNSGIANSCTGDRGMTDVLKTADLVKDHLGLASGESVFVSSTGKIGDFLPMDKIAAGVKSTAEHLSSDGGADAAAAIMTTDTRPKSLAVSLEIGGQRVYIGGMTKGAGMIGPRLATAMPEATMLAFMTTDANVSQDFLRGCLDRSLDSSFNRISVDGDCSTNDTFLALANGQAKNDLLTDEHAESAAFEQAFAFMASTLAQEIVRDGEGATKFVELRVTGAASSKDAYLAANAIANSALCKTAWFGCDPNWGRILVTAGCSGARINPDETSLYYGNTAAVLAGMPAESRNDALEAELKKENLNVTLDLGVGDAETTIWTCDLSYDYVRINAEYHT